jgi:tRNA/rRNA methyltransferase
VPATPPPDWAGIDEVQATLAHWRTALQAIGYLDPRLPKKLMPRLNQLANRLTLTREEVHILRGMARAMQRAGQLATRGAEQAPDH